MICVNGINKWYAPNNATLVVSGDVQAEEVYHLAKKYFGPLPAGKACTKTAAEPGSRFKTVLSASLLKGPQNYPICMMAYKVPVLKTAIDQPEREFLYGSPMRWRY